MKTIPEKEWNEGLNYILEHYRDFIIEVGKV